MQEECRQERALTARAHHNCQLNAREARRFHALWERHRNATTAFLANLERAGLIERGTLSEGADLTPQFSSVSSQLVLNAGYLEVCVIHCTLYSRSDSLPNQSTSLSMSITWRLACLFACFLRLVCSSIHPRTHLPIQYRGNHSPFYPSSVPNFAISPFIYSNNYRSIRRQQILKKCENSFNY